MYRRWPLFLAILMITTAFPLMVGAPVTGTDARSEGESRYGFTMEGDWTSAVGNTALCVATGDFDGLKNDDIVAGGYENIYVYLNNGDGKSFTGPTTYPLTGYHIAKVKTADYDDDGDIDIIAMGQEYYYMADDLNTAMGPEIGTIRIFYMENDAGSFSIETYADIDNGLYAHDWWLMHDGVFDMEVADADNDDDIDTFILYNADRDGNAGNLGERMQVAGIIYESGSLTWVNLTHITYSQGYTWGMLDVKDFDTPTDGYPDITFVFGGQIGGSFKNADIYMIWHSGSGTTYDAPTSLGSISKGGIWPDLPYAIATGHFSGVNYIDIAISVGAAQEETYKDASIYLIRGRPSRGFDPAMSNLAYTENNNYFFRDLIVGNFNNSVTSVDDMVGLKKMDITTDNPYSEIGAWGLTSLRNYNPNTPSKFVNMKIIRSKPDGTGGLPHSRINALAVGNFDNDPNGLDDIVWAGDNVTAKVITYPANHLPREHTIRQDPSPVKNNFKDIVTLNFTLEDLDGQYDMTYLIVDLTPLGLNPETFATPDGYSPDDGNLAWYEFSKKIPENVPEGYHRINFTMRDKAGGESSDFFLLNIIQYNRNPIPADDLTINLTLEEDTPTYFEGVYSWFHDADNDPLEIQIKNSFGSWTTENTNEMFTVELVNGTMDPTKWALLITPKENRYHTEGGFDPKIVTMRASDGTLKSEEVIFKVFIESVNDLPIIRPQGSPGDNFEFMLVQDDPGWTQILASDPNDGDPDGIYLTYYLGYEDEMDMNWLTCTPEGKITWKPTNDNVGDHMVTAWVDDGDANVSKVFWFNVSNVIDKPFFVSISNGTTRIDLPKHVTERVVFTVYEHRELNLSIIANDLDREIDLQTKITFFCNLTQNEATYLDIDPDDPFKATLHFMAEGKYYYFATNEPRYPAVRTEIIIMDEMSSDVLNVLPIEIIIINVNDPPILLEIDSPEEGDSYPILYNHKFSVGNYMDPDTIYNDTLRFIWDFDAADDFQEDSEGQTVYWDFKRAGTYKVTLRCMDDAGNFLDAYVNITVSGKVDSNDWDNDGIPNEWEVQFTLDPYDPYDAGKDADGDGWSNLDEFLNGTDPQDMDTDDDGVRDSEDYDPLDKFVSEKEKKDPKWYEETSNIIIIIVITVVLLLIIALLLFGYIIRSRKRAEEEEEKRKQAEELEKSLYEDQNLYQDLPSVAAAQQQAALTAPTQPTLPSAPSDDLGDIFGGAGTLPTAQEQPVAAPPSPAAAPAQVPPQGQPQAQLPPPPQEGTQPAAPQQATSDDLSELL